MYKRQGYLLFVPREDTIQMDMSVEEAAKLIISAGIVVPDQDYPASRYFKASSLLNN